MEKYKLGLQLYHYFKEAVMAQDRAKIKRLEQRLDEWYTKLPPASRREFCQVLCRQGLVTGTLKAVIETFDAAIMPGSIAQAPQPKD